MRGTQGQLVAGGYTVEKVLSTEGAESDVYLVTRDGQKYVYKLYRHAIQDAERSRRQQRMAEKVQRLSELGHGHVVQLFDHGVDDTNHMYEVQEYIELGSLTDWLRQSGKMSQETSLNALSELLEAVHYLHQQHVTHRDIKPGNILVRSRGDDGERMDLVLTDFGISSLMREETDQVFTDTANRTPLYSPPEALIGIIKNSYDYWSIGMVILEILTGRNPYAGYDTHVVEQQKQRTHVPLPDDLEPRWKTLFNGLFRIIPEKRWGYDEVTRWVAGEEVPVARETSDDLEQSGVVFLRVDDRDYSSPREWAADALNRPRAWDQAALSLARGYVNEPLKGYYQNRDVGRLNRIADVLENDSPDRNLKLFDLIYAIDESMPFGYRGVVLVTEDQPADTQELVRNTFPLAQALTEFYEAQGAGGDTFRPQAVDSVISSRTEHVEPDELTYERLQGIAKAVVQDDLLSRYYKTTRDDDGVRWATAIETHVHSTSKTANRAPSKTPKSGAGKAKDRPESSDLPAAALTYRMLLMNEYGTCRESLAKTLAARIYSDCDMVANARSIVDCRYEADGPTLSLVNDYVQNNGYTPESVLNMLQGTSTVEVLWQCFLDLSASKPCSNPALATDVTQGHLFSHYLEWKDDDQSLLAKIREAEGQMDAYETLTERLLACVVLVYDLWDRVIDFVVKKYDGKLICDDRLDAALNYFRAEHSGNITVTASGTAEGT
jgi:serine/threonine protein kinase